MSVENSEEALKYRQACAACKHQRRKCQNHCVLAPYFPATRANYFREVHKIFGVKNITGILEHLSPQERKRAVKSLEWEAFAWKEDPIEGPLGLLRKLEKEVELLKNQQNPQQQNIIVGPYQTKSGFIGFNHNSVEIVANTNINATNCGYANNPNFVLDGMTNYVGLLQTADYNYAGLLQRADNIENQGLDNYISVDAYYPIPQEEGRSAILQERNIDAVAQTTTLLPKEEMQRNQILCNSATPVAKSFNQGHHQRGSHGRVHAYFDGSVNGSQRRGLY